MGYLYLDDGCWMLELPLSLTAGGRRTGTETERSIRSHTTPTIDGRRKVARSNPVLSENIPLRSLRFTPAFDLRPHAHAPLSSITCATSPRPLRKYHTIAPDSIIPHPRQYTHTHPHPTPPKPLAPDFPPSHSPARTYSTLLFQLTHALCT